MLSVVDVKYDRVNHGTEANSISISSSTMKASITHGLFPLDRFQASFLFIRVTYTVYTASKIIFSYSRISITREINIYLINGYTNVVGT